MNFVLSILSEVALKKSENGFVWANWLTQLKMRTAVMTSEESVEDVLKFDIFFLFLKELFPLGTKLLFFSI